jgi:tripartite-type tricarboxylate transporter receptor subunit TctC
MITAGILLAMAASKATDNYPSRPIVLVIPLSPGGTNDIMARAVADKMSDTLGQRIVIENRNAGGSGTVGTREVARTIPDGYTLVLGYTSTLATGPHIFSNVGYDPRKDFAPLGLIASAPALLLVHRDLPVRTVRELIVLMKGSKEPYQVATPRRRHCELSGIGAVRAASWSSSPADHREGFQSTDHGYDGRLRQSGFQSDSRVATRH